MQPTGSSTPRSNAWNSGLGLHLHDLRCRGGLSHSAAQPQAAASGAGERVGHWCVDCLLRESLEAWSGWVDNMNHLKVPRFLFLFSFADGFIWMPDY